MRFILIFTFTILLSCNTKQGAEKAIVASEKIEAYDNSNTEILETFVDSLNIGRKGKCKIELIKHRVYNNNYVIIKFYIKTPNAWSIQNTYSYETNALMEFQPFISDYNNDNLNDLTFISGTAARGANEVRRLFIYDDQKQQLTSIVNSQDYPNMDYNNELDCIDAFMVYGASATVFAKIVGDSLKTFACVANSLDFTTIYIIDKKGNYKELYKVKGHGIDMRYKNYKPLVEYNDEK